MQRIIRMTSPLLLLLAVAFLAVYPTTASSSWPREEDRNPPHVRKTSHPVEEMAEDRWATLDAAVQAEAARFPGTLSVLAVDLTTGQQYTYQPENQFHPASTMKVAVAVCTARAVGQGALSWETAVPYTPADFDPDEPTDMEEYPYETAYSIQELVGNSLSYSSNVATHMLVRTLTWQGLLACSSDLGGPVTWGPDGATPVTVQAVAAWWQALWNLAANSPDQAAVILQALRGATYTGRIAAGTPEPALVTHKFGSVDDTFHDSAIIWSEHPYLLVVLTRGAGEGEADEAIAGLAAAAWAGVSAAGGTAR